MSKTYEINRPFPTDVTSPKPTQLIGPKVTKDSVEENHPSKRPESQKKGDSK